MSCQKNSSCCGCGSETVQATEEINKSTLLGQELYKTVYHLAKMDCSAEEHMVRMVLADLIYIQDIQFNLAQRQVTVWHKLNNIDEISLKLDSLQYNMTLLDSSLQVYQADTKNDEQSQKKILKILLMINFTLFLLELMTGLWAKSTGLLGDALDMLADALVYGIALYAVGKSLALQKQASKIAGFTQLTLAILLLIDIIRRYWFGSEPISFLMITMSCIALIGNVICLYLVAQRQNDGVHMKASYIFSANDVLINCGVIVAGLAVWYFKSPLPDLLIGMAIVAIIINGSRKILSLK